MFPGPVQEQTWQTETVTLNEAQTVQEKTKQLTLHKIDSADPQVPFSLRTPFPFPFPLHLLSAELSITAVAHLLSQRPQLDGQLASIG